MAGAVVFTIAAVVYQKWWIPRSLPSIGQAYVLGAITGTAILLFLQAFYDLIKTRRGHCQRGKEKETS